MESGRIAVRSILGFLLFSTSYCITNGAIYYKYVRPLRQEEREILERELIEADRAGFHIRKHPYKSTMVDRLSGKEVNLSGSDNTSKSSSSLAAVKKQCVTINEKSDTIKQQRFAEKLQAVENIYNCFTPPLSHPAIDNLPPGGIGLTKLPYGILKNIMRLLPPVRVYLLNLPLQPSPPWKMDVIDVFKSLQITFYEELQNFIDPTRRTIHRLQGRLELVKLPKIGIVLETLLIPSCPDLLITACYIDDDGIASLNENMSSAPSRKSKSITVVDCFGHFDNLWELFEHFSVITYHPIHCTVNAALQRLSRQKKLGRIRLGLTNLEDISQIDKNLLIMFFIKHSACILFLDILQPTTLSTLKSLMHDFADDVLQIDFPAFDAAYIRVRRVQKYLSNRVNGISRLKPNPRWETVKSQIHSKELTLEDYFGSKSRNEKVAMVERKNDHDGTGLTNRNRECYINSVLQCLSNTHAFKQIAPESYLRSVETHRLHPFSEALRAVLMDLWAATKDITVADKLKRLFRDRHSHMDNDQDQDAHEALEFILEMVHDELKTTNAPQLANNDENVENIVSQGLTAWAQHVAANESFITHAFDGLTGSEIQCRKCDFVSPSFETFRSFNVTLHHDTNLHVRFFYANDSQTQFTERRIVVPQNYTTTDLKREIANDQGVPEDRLYLHLRNEAAVDNSEYLMTKVAPLSEREQLVVYELPSTDAKLTPCVCLQRKIPVHYGIDFVAIPLMFQVPEKISGAQFYKMVNDYIQRIKAIHPMKGPLQMNRPIEVSIDTPEQLPFDLVYTDQSGNLCSLCPIDKHCHGCYVPTNDTSVDWTTNITIQWKATPHSLNLKRLFDLVLTLDDSKESRRKLSECKLVSLESALDKTLHPELLDTPFNCEGCKEKCFFQKRLYFVHTPTTLVVNLQRFAPAKCGGWVKDKRHVTFPLVDFDMTPYFGPGFKPAGLYECIAFIVHFGELHTGHYVSYYKKNDTWYLCDDEKVYTIPLSQVQFHNASVIFYQLQGLSPHPVLFPEGVGASQEDFVVPDDPDPGFAGKESKDEYVVPQMSRLNVASEKSNDGAVTPEKSKSGPGTPEKLEKEAVVAEKPESQAEVAEESKNQAVAADVLDNQAVNNNDH